jgi:hypothetical protein
MPTPIEIVEVLGRSEQGHTRPYICRASDGEIYFVKGSGAGRRSQICELIAGRLAQILVLPIAPFAIVEVPEELIREGGNFLGELGAGPAFGSLKKSVNELTLANLDEIPDKLQQDVLVFDRWVRNGDRMLNERGGNPNLFLEPGAHALVVIDHNLAFDKEFSQQDLLAYHVFKDQGAALASDFLLRAEYNARLSSALKQWSAIVAEVPPGWWYSDPEMTLKADFDLIQTLEWLKEFQRDNFWKWQ